MTELPKPPAHRLDPHDFPLGVAWYPEWEPPGAWEADLIDMREAGLNTVRICEFSWEHIQAEPHRFDFTLYDAVVRRCEELELGIVLGVDTVRPPNWVFQRYPDMHLLDNLGRRRAPGRSTASTTPPSPSCRRRTSPNSSPATRRAPRSCSTRSITSRPMPHALRRGVPVAHAEPDGRRARGRRGPPRVDVVGRVGVVAGRRGAGRDPGRHARVRAAWAVLGATVAFAADVFRASPDGSRPLGALLAALVAGADARPAAQVEGLDPEADATLEVVLRDLPGGLLAFVINASPEPCTPLLRLPAAGRARDILTGAAFDLRDGAYGVPMEPYSVLVLEAPR